MRSRRLLVAVSAAVLTIGMASPVAAQTPPPAQSAKDSAKSGGERKPGQRKVVRLEEMRVEGRVQKPQALFVMPRANVSSGEQPRSESFLSKTQDAVAKDPF